jgi:hypothetical protein
MNQNPTSLPATSQLRRVGNAVALLLGICVLGWATAAAAQPAAAGIETGRAAAPARFVLPLSRVAGSDRPLRLSGVAAATTLPLPMPALWQPEDVRLELAGTASMALNNGSQLEVSVNGRVVQQLRLDGRQPAFRQEIVLPVAALRDGFNDVQVAVAQHYTDRCEYTMAPQLWTELDLANSRFVVTATPRAALLRLDRLDALFDKTSFDEMPLVRVLTAAAPAGEVLAAQSLVAQGVGQRYDYAPVRLESGRFPAQLAALGASLPAGARGAVVVGRFDQVGSYLEGLGVPADAGPVAALRALPGDATRFVLVLAAAKDADLPVAATAFAMQRLPWPARPWVSIRELKCRLWAR